MAYRIECDRCGETERVDEAGAIPTTWLQFNSPIWGDGRGTAKPSISGGVFCPECGDDLARWRKNPTPKAIPADECGAFMGRAKR